MTEEVKNVEVQQECFCKKRFKDVFVVAIGSFVGVFCALSLFSALHRPHFHQVPMFYPAMHHGMFGQQMGQHRMLPMGGKFRPDKFKGDFEQRKPVENKE